jgi:hypothetical protein
MATVSRVSSGKTGMATHSRYPESERNTAYTESYRTIRLVVGFLGIALPLVFIVGEARYLRGGVHVRGSLSAHYHTSMQDIFVGGLCVIGFLLATYLAGERRTWDFWASLLAGLAVLGVVFFPTSRSGLAPNALHCEEARSLPGCSFVEYELGESHTAVIHAVCAAVFILGMAAMSFLFAASEVQAGSARSLSARGLVLRSTRLFWIHRSCAAVILAAGAWAVVGGALHADLGPLTPLYVGEVVAVWAFGVSWLLAGYRLTAPPRVPAAL